MTVRVTLHPDFTVAPIDRRLFGSFVEHLGRAVYTGIYEPGHPTADGDGFRQDVLDLTRELGVTLVRYPGGNFVSGYVWEDGVGPRAARKPTLDLAWRTIDPNTVGTDEFLAWADRAGVEPMLAVNLGTRGAAEAAALVEYCNAPVGSRWSDLRAANGRVEPYGVRLWCLGNEMDGPWQLGHSTAQEYGLRAAQAGHAMRLVDPTIELVACGSSSMDMPTFGPWERTVLARTFDLVDHISMHAYYEELDGDRASFLASGTAMDRFIDRVTSSADAVAAERLSDKRIAISFDEWNVWYRQSRFVGEQNLPLQGGKDGPPRLLEDVHSALDAVVVGDLMITLLNHADRVRVACLAQLVNVIAPIMTEPGGSAWRQPTFHPIAATNRLARGSTLYLRVETPTMTTAQHGQVPVVTAAGTWDADDGALALFLVNRSAEPIDVLVEHCGLRVTLDGATQVVADHEPAVTGPDHAARVAREYVREIAPKGARGVVGQTSLTLAPESWTVFHGHAERD
jgi:alpha-N-arabinofuranosidase